MAKLDRDQPYGEVWGDGSGFRGYEQNGRMFRSDGTPFDDDGDEPEPVVDPSAALVSGRGAGLAKARAARAAKRAASQAATTPDANASPVSEFSDLADDELKALVEVNGGTWTDRDAAIAFLGEK